MARILLVDDDQLVSEYLATLLESENYQVTVQNEPVKALEDFLQHADDYDLVVTDQIMPELTGIDMAKAMLEAHPEKPIVLITGYSEKVSQENASSYGLRGFFSKPINEEQFLQRINQLLI